jgi:hypothetical protein
MNACDEPGREPVGDGGRRSVSPPGGEILVLSEQAWETPLAGPVPDDLEVLERKLHELSADGSPEGATAGGLIGRALPVPDLNRLLHDFGLPSIET